MANINIYVSEKDREEFTRFAERIKKSGKSINKVVLQLIKNYQLSNTCPSCHSDIEPDDTFCRKCGNKI